MQYSTNVEPVWHNTVPLHPTPNPSSLELSTVCVEVDLLTIFTVHSIPQVFIL